MKKLVLVMLSVGLLLAAIVFGPAALDLYRLDRHINVSAQAYEAERGPWPQVSDTCVNCHGVDGRSVNQHYPSLAGQPSSYLAGQLRNYASGARVHPIMNAMARSLNPGEIDSLASYFARQPASDNRYFEPDQGLLEQGRPLVAAGACAACHGEGLMGKEQFPRLAGMGYDYLLKQLDGFADGSRRDHTQAMNALASSWSPAQRKAIAAILASHPVAKSHQAAQ